MDSTTPDTAVHGGRFRFGEWEIDTDAFLLHRGADAVHVEPEVFGIRADR